MRTVTVKWGYIVSNVYLTYTLIGFQCYPQQIETYIWNNMCMFLHSNHMHTIHTSTTMQQHKFSQIRNVSLSAGHPMDVGSERWDVVVVTPEIKLAMPTLVR